MIKMRDLLKESNKSYKLPSGMQRKMDQYIAKNWSAGKDLLQILNRIDNMAKFKKLFDVAVKYGANAVNLSYDGSADVIDLCENGVSGNSSKFENAPEEIPYRVLIGNKVKVSYSTSGGNEEDYSINDFREFINLNL